MHNYFVGTTITITGVARNAGGTATDPGDVWLKVRNPAGSVSTYQYSAGGVLKTATGTYSKALELTASGIWWLRFEGSAPLDATVELPLNVYETMF